MRPKEQGGSGRWDSFQERLDQIVGRGHPSVKLADKIDWRFLAERLARPIPTG